MKSLFDWKLQKFKEDFNPMKAVGNNSALGNTTQKVDMQLMSRMKSSLLPYLRKEYGSDDETALVNMIVAAASLLKELGSTISPGEFLNAFNSEQPQTPNQGPPNV